MGNLIDDFWTYSYKGTKYYGIVEVIKGDLEKQLRSVKKYETNIHKALEYTMQNKALSHMSIQTYCTALHDRINREQNEQKYYPFVLEFEDRNNKNYNSVVMEAVVYINYLVNKYGINREDILIMINNSKSIYVSVNPKVYNLKPSKILHKTYANMYSEIKAELGLTYTDPSIVVSHYKLMKTPNSFYKDGYFVKISFEELTNLMLGMTTKQELTQERRSLNIDVPGIVSFDFTKLYKKAHEKALNIKNTYREEIKKNQVLEGKCVEMFMSELISKGYRNQALVSVGIYLKNAGYTQVQVKENLIILGQAWNHDENERKISIIVNEIFKRDYSFSCSYVRNTFEELGIESLCNKCPYASKCNKVNDGTINIDRAIINELWKNKASTRHYLLYLDLIQKKLLNKAFIPEQYGINERTLRELLRKCRLLKKSKQDSGVEIDYSSSGNTNTYSLPVKFINETAIQLGEYLKHYLKLIVKGYKAFSKYILLRISKEKIAEELGYTDISSLYKFLEKLKGIGLIKVHKNCTFELHFESFKVIEIPIGISNIEKIEKYKYEYKVVGEQLVFGKKKYGEIFIWGLNRGSP